MWPRPLFFKPPHGLFEFKKSENERSRGWQLCLPHARVNILQVLLVLTLKTQFCCRDFITDYITSSKTMVYIILGFSFVFVYTFPKMVLCSTCILRLLQVFETLSKSVLYSSHNPVVIA